MPDKKIKKFRNPITKRERTITKEDGVKQMYITDYSTYEEGETVRFKHKDKKKKKKYKYNFKKGGKIRNVFTEQYD